MQLYSKIYGDSNHNLVIIHGLFGMSDNWLTLGRRFSKYYRVHLIDLRNHGRSPHSTEFNYHVICEDICQYIKEKNILKPILLGHSLGGKVAMKFAFDYPSMVDRLIVVDIAPRRYNTNFHEALLQKLVRLDLENSMNRRDIDDALSLVVENSSIRSFLLKNLHRDENQKFTWRFNLNGLINTVRNIQEDSFVKGVCSTPTYFIRGGDSDYINSNDEIIIKRHFSATNIITIEKTGHWLHAEKPEEFFNTVIRLLNISQFN